MGVKINDKTDAFRDFNDESVDMVLNGMAIDIERKAKMMVPVLTGALKGAIYHRRISLKRYYVIANKEYAAYQHEGKRKDGSHIVRKYTKAGSGKHFLKIPGEEVGKDFPRRYSAMVMRRTLTSTGVDLDLGNFGN
jgi:hypothetical protein